MPKINGVWYRAPSEILEVPSQERVKKVSVNSSRLRPPESLITVFEYANTIEPPFSVEEQWKFAVAYKETPGDFGTIASVLPGRTRADCVRHYNATKEGKRYQCESNESKHQAKTEIERMRKNYLLKFDYLGKVMNVPAAKHAQPQEGGRKRIKIDQHGYRRVHRDRPEDEASGPLPIDEEIARLKKLCGGNERPYVKAYPRLAQEETVLSMPDLSILHGSFQPPFTVSDNDLAIWLRSADVLPLVKEWYTRGMEILPLYLPGRAFPWHEQALDIAYFAQECEQHNATLDDTYPKGLHHCVEYAIKISHGNELGIFSHFAPFVCNHNFRCLAGAHVLLTAYADLRLNVDGFFGTLLNSELAGPVKASSRRKWEKKYIFAGEPGTNAEDMESTTRSDSVTSSLPPFRPEGMTAKPPLFSQFDAKSFNEAYCKWQVDCKSRERSLNTIEKPKPLEKAYGIENSDVFEKPKAVKKPETVDDSKTIEKLKRANKPKETAKPRGSEKPNGIEKSKRYGKPKPVEKPTAFANSKSIEKPRTVNTQKAIAKPKATEQLKKLETPKTDEKPKAASNTDVRMPQLRQSRVKYSTFMPWWSKMSKS